MAGNTVLGNPKDRLVTLAVSETLRILDSYHVHRMASGCDYKMMDKTLVVLHNLALTLPVGESHGLAAVCSILD